MKLINSTFVLTLSSLALLTGCFGGGGGGGGGGNSVTSGNISAYSCYSNFSVEADGNGGFTVDGDFCDNNVNFPANAMVVSNPPFRMKDVWNSIIPHAYADSSNKEPVSCKKNEVIPSMTVNVLNNTKTVILADIDCSEDMDLAIRQAVAEKSLEGMTLLAEYDDGKLLRYDDEVNPPEPVILSIPNASITGTTIAGVPQGDHEGKCFNKYSFDNQGNVTIELDTASTTGGYKQKCLDKGGRYFNHNGVELPFDVSSSELANFPSYSVKCKKDFYASRYWDATLNNGVGGYELSRDIDGNLIEVDPEEPNSINQVQLGSCSEFFYKKIAKYRFRDGYIEIDKQPEYVSENGGTKAYYKFSDGVNLNTNVKSNTKRFRLNEYTRFCVQGTGNSCDRTRYPSTSVSLPNSDDY